MSIVVVNSTSSITVTASVTQVVEIRSSVGPQGPAGTDGTIGADGLGVPAGGATGQILTKVSATDNDTTWSTPDISQIYKYAGFFSGFWYRAGFGATLALANSANVFSGSFFRSPVDIPISGLGIDITTAYTGNYILGIYEISEIDPNVGTIAYQTPEQVAVSALGPQEIAATFTLLRNKLYVLGIINDASLSLRSANTSESLAIGAISPQDSVSVGEKWSGALTYGVLADFTVVSGITFRPPLVWFRRA